EEGRNILLRENSLARREVGTPTELFELAHLELIQRCAHAKSAYSTFRAALPVEIDCNQRRLHTGLRWAKRKDNCRILTDADSSD
ncbi:MAG: hypothetical protein E6614_30585, partial [Bradyrhizobium sp.]|nr:hypothetical protein [Bradyrhizobium sp.]